MTIEAEYIIIRKSIFENSDLRMEKQSWPRSGQVRFGVKKHVSNREHRIPFSESLDECSSTYSDGRDKNQTWSGKDTSGSITAKRQDRSRKRKEIKEVASIGWTPEELSHS